MLLLPEAVEDYVGPDNPVRFIDAFVDRLDLREAGFARVEAKATGRPGYAPADLLKLYIYGTLNRVRSSRRLEAEARRNIEVIWLVRHLKPDFKTIADFRRENRAAFHAVFREFVVLCRRLDLFGRELLAVDGTRIKAVNNKDRNFTRGALTTFIREADEKLAEYMRRLDAGDADEEPASDGIGTDRGDGKLAEKIAAIGARRDRHKALLAELDRTGESQIPLTDPDARAMARMTKVGVGYNVQIAVDVKHHLIAEQEVSNQVLDLGLLAACGGGGDGRAGRGAHRGRGRPGHLQDRGPRGLREGRRHRLCPQARARPRGARGLLLQGGVPPRPGAGHLHLSRRPDPLAALSGTIARQRQDRLLQQGRLQGLRPQAPLHSKLPARLAAGRTRPCSTAWPRGWPRVPTSSTNGARAPVTPSARSSSGCRARS